MFKKKKKLPEAEERYIKKVKEYFVDGELNEEEVESLGRLANELGIDEKRAESLKNEVLFEWTIPHKLMGLVALVGAFILLVISLVLNPLIFVLLVVYCYLISRIMKFFASKTSILFRKVFKLGSRHKLPFQFCFVESQIVKLLPTKFMEHANVTIRKTLFSTLFAFFLMSLFLSDSGREAIGGVLSGENNLFGVAFLLGVIFIAPIATIVSSIIMVFQDSSLMVYSVKERRFTSFGDTINRQFRAVGGFGALISLLNKVVEVAVSSPHETPTVVLMLLFIFIISYPFIFLCTYFYLRYFHRDVVKRFDEGLKMEFPQFKLYKLEEKEGILTLKHVVMAHQKTTTLEELSLKTSLNDSDKKNSDGASVPSPLPGKEEEEKEDKLSSEQNMGQEGKKE